MESPDIRTTNETSGSTEGEGEKREKKENKRKEEEGEASLEDYWELTKRLGFKGGEKNMKEYETDREREKDLAPEVDL